MATRALVVLHKAAQHDPPPSTLASPCQRGAGWARRAPVERELVEGASPLLSDDESDGGGGGDDDGAGSGDDGDESDGGAYPER